MSWERLFTYRVSGRKVHAFKYGRWNHYYIGSKPPTRLRLCNKRIAPTLYIAIMNHLSRVQHREAARQVSA
jgi:hypothetical protein